MPGTSLAEPRTAPGNPCHVLYRPAGARRCCWRMYLPSEPHASGQQVSSPIAAPSDPSTELARPVKARRLQASGDDFARLGRWPEAGESYESALDIFRDIGGEKSLDYEYCLKGLGTALVMQGRLEMRTLPLPRERSPGNAGERPSALCRRPEPSGGAGRGGRSCKIRGERLEHASAISEAAEGPNNTALALYRQRGRLAESYSRLGEPTRAEVAARQAVGIYGTLRDGWVRVPSGPLLLARYAETVPPTRSDETI